MKLRQIRPGRLATVALVALSLLPLSANAEQVRVTLSGSAEVPPVQTAASGGGIINIGVDQSITGSVTTVGISGTMAHIHLGVEGKNGPVVIPLEKVDGNGWAVPAGTKLTDEQFSAFKAGELYVNVHSDAHKGGEIRGQLKP